MGNDRSGSARMSICEVFSETGRVELKVCSPHQSVRLISARLSGQIRALQSLWPSAPKRFIFNGLELLEAMTFDFYGIRNGDSIIALPLDQHSVYRTTQWLAMSRDTESFNESLKWMLDPRTSAEAARLRDLHLVKVEHRPKMFLKMCATFEADDGEENRASRGTVLGLPPEAPSCEALPVDWSMAGM
jgi:hypothetical protein